VQTARLRIRNLLTDDSVESRHVGSMDQTLTVQLKIAAPMEEALRLAAREDETTLGHVVRDAIAREIRRRRLIQAAAAKIPRGGPNEPVMAS